MLVNVIVGVFEGVSDTRLVGRLVLVSLGVTRMIIILGAVAVAVAVGVSVETGPVELATGAGTATIPIAPTRINTNPLIELTIKSLGYLIRLQ